VFLLSWYKVRSKPVNCQGILFLLRVGVSIAKTVTSLLTLPSVLVKVLFVLLSCRICPDSTNSFSFVIEQDLSFKTLQSQF